MLNYDGGYIGRSRSVRSQKAIDSFEVPISLINRTLVEKFLDQYKDFYSINELAILKKASVAKWKYIAKMKVSSSSWHHTSYRYNRTSHYKLTSLAEVLIRNHNVLDTEYKAYRTSREKRSPRKDLL